MKIKTENGEEVEVYTQAEMDAKFKEMTESVGAVAEGVKTMGEQLGNFQKETTDSLAAAQAAINSKGEGGDDGGGQPAGVNSADMEAALAKVREEGKQEIETFKKDMTKDTRDELLKAYTKDMTDEDKAKVEVEFDNYRSTDMTKSAMEERVRAAVTLVTGAVPRPAATDNLGAPPAGGTPPAAPKAEGEGLSEDGKGLAKQMGITEEELKALEESDKS